jgi:hypothetical protein
MGFIDKLRDCILCSPSFAFLASTATAVIVAAVTTAAIIAAARKKNDNEKN